MKYLSESIRTLEELKKAYHQLCLKLHPDVGGSDEEMKILNAEYEQLFERVKNIHVNKDGETYERDRDHRLLCMGHRRYQATQGTPESSRFPLAFEKTLLVQIARGLPPLGKR